MSRRASFVYLAAMLAGLPIYFFVFVGMAQRLAFYGYGFSSVAAIVCGLRMHRPGRRWPWIAFAGGTLLFVAGDIAFDVYAGGGKTVPVPSATDFVYLSAYPILAWGLILLVRYRVRGADMTSALDGAMVAIGAAVAAWVFVMAPYAHDRALGLGAKIVPIAYPALDLLLVAVLVRLLLSRGAWNPGFRLLAASIVTLLVADGFFAVASLHNTYVDGSVIDLGWLLSYALWGAAALHPSMTGLTDPAPPNSARRGRVALVMLAVAALASPATLIVEDSQGVHTDVALLAAASLVMFVLVLARVALLTRALDSSNRQLILGAARQRVLTDAAVALVSADNIESVARTGVRAAVALAGHAESWSAFVASGPPGPTVLAVAGPAPCRVGDAADPELAATCVRSYAVEGPTRLAAAARAAGSERAPAERYVASVTVDGQIRGRLLVGRIANSAEAFLPTLGLVCWQMGLALQNAETTEERLRDRTERKFRSLVQNSSDVITLVGTDRRVSYQSPGARTLFGREPDSLVGMPFGRLIHPDDTPAALAELTTVLEGGLASSAHFECRASHADGSWREVDVIMTNLVDDPDVGAVVLNKRDVTERRALERELNHQAFHDPLTGLANRALFLDRVAHALERAQRHAEPVAVLMMDLDDFKMVNESLGHPAGDEVLVAVAERLHVATRPGDTTARLGGDEFAVLLESGEMPDAAQVVARRIAEALTAPVPLGDKEVSVRASIGIALDQPPTARPDDLLRDADLAMYLAKHNGKGRFEMYRPAMHEQAVRRLEMSAELRRAIDTGQLEVFYQPIVNAHNAMPVGAEALVRWHHPSRGLVAPTEFIPLAETTGLIVRLGQRVLAEACRQVQTWRQCGLIDDSFYISVNVSALQLLEPGLIEDVAAVLQDSGLPAGALVLEITESALMENLDAGVDRLHALKALGLRLAVDDFGTGYSSFSYLHELPFDLIKIDKSFVDRINLDPEGEALVRSVVELSRTLGLTSIAEGVEQADQHALLDEIGCDNIQGYVFAKPMPKEQFADALAQLRNAPQGTNKRQPTGNHDSAVPTPQAHHERAVTGLPVALPA